MVTPSSTWSLTGTTETGWPNSSNLIKQRSFSEPMDWPVSLPGQELRPCTRVSYQHREQTCSVTTEELIFTSTCRFLESRGCHQAFRLPGCDHRRPVLLLLLLPAQHSGPVCGDRRRQPQEEPHVGHREPATVRRRAGWRGAWSEQQCRQASGSVPHEPAIEFFRFVSLKIISGRFPLSPCSP